MSEDKVTRTFPPGEPKGLDLGLFKNHLRQAVRRYVSRLEDGEVSTLKRTVFRLHEGGIGSQDIEFPAYHRQWDHEIARKILPYQEMRAFFDYLWDRGELRKTLTGTNPQRESWELFVLFEVIHDTVTRVLEDLSIDEAADTGTVTLWRLPEPALERALDEVLVRVIEGKCTYVAKCPIAWVKASLGSAWVIDDDVTLKVLTPQERVRHLSRHHNKILWHDTLSGLIQEDAAVLEMVGKIDLGQLRRGRPPKTGNDVLEETIAETIDIAKWALVISAGYVSPPIEATITYQDILGGPISIAGFGSFRRQEAHQGTVYDLNAIDMKRVSSLFRKARKLAEAFQDVRQSFWYWGRSCLAALERDVLLESVIGLENLIVQCRGENRYRFGLHGAALMATSDGEAQELASQLRKLYDKRSSSAHGSADERVREAAYALNYLSRAILSVIELCESGVFSVGNRIAQQIETRILVNSPLR